MDSLNHHDPTSSHSVLPASLGVQDSHTSSGAQRTRTTPHVGGSGENTSPDALSTSSATLPMHGHMMPGAKRGHTPAQRQCGGEECSGVTGRHRGPTDNRLVRQSPARTHISRLTRLSSMASAAGGQSLDPSSQIPDPNVKSQSQKPETIVRYPFGRNPQKSQRRELGDGNWSSPWDLIKSQRV